MGRIRGIFATVHLLLASSACFSSDEPCDYMMPAGSKAVFRVAGTGATINLVALPEREFNGETVRPFVFGENLVFIRCTETEKASIARQEPGMPDPQVKECPDVELRAPLVADAAWETTTMLKLTMLPRLDTFSGYTPRELFPAPCVQRSVVVATKETVGLKSGVLHEDCLRLHRTMAFEAPILGGQKQPRGVEHIEVTTDEWFAPELGIVKLIRTERATAEFKGKPPEKTRQAAYEMELVEHTP